MEKTPNPLVLRQNSKLAQASEEVLKTRLTTSPTTNLVGAYESFRLNGSGRLAIRCDFLSLYSCQCILWFQSCGFNVGLVGVAWVCYRSAAGFSYCCWFKSVGFGVFAESMQGLAV